MANTPAPALRPLHMVATEAARLIRNLPDTHMAKWAGMAQIMPLTGVAPGQTHYGYDSVEYVLACALGNITGWRGEDAKRIRAELKAHAALLRKTR